MEVIVNDFVVVLIFFADPLLLNYTQQNFDYSKTRSNCTVREHFSKVDMGTNNQTIPDRRFKYCHHYCYYRNTTVHRLPRNLRTQAAVKDFDVDF